MTPAAGLATRKRLKRKSNKPYFRVMAKQTDVYGRLTAAPEGCRESDRLHPLSS